MKMCKNEYKSLHIIHRLKIKESSLKSRVHLAIKAVKAIGKNSCLKNVSWHQTV